MRRFIVSIILAAALLGGGAASAETIRVGVTPGPHAQIMENIAERAASQGLTIKVVEFSDYVLPNAALAQGDLDANSFQHQPYLDNQIKDRGYPLVSVAKTVIFPMGLYSKKVKSLSEVSDGATIGIPNDPSNGGRALLLLQKVGFLKLSPTAGLKASVADIVENSRKLKIVELDAAQLPRSLDDTALSAINTNYAMEAGLSPVRDALAREDSNSPYANVIAVRAQDKDKPWVATLVKLYQSAETKAFIEKTFGASVDPAF
jgi:D-methionine transport system substrate-binding protein